MRRPLDQLTSQFALRAALLNMVSFFVLSSWGLSQEISFRLPDSSYSIDVSATSRASWNEGGYQVIHLAGDVKVEQGGLTANADEGVLFLQDNLEADIVHRKAIVYLEGNVVVDLPSPGLSNELSTSPGQPQLPVANSSNRIVDQVWLARLYTEQEIQFTGPIQRYAQPTSTPVYDRARAAVQAGATPSAVQPVQFQDLPHGTQVLVSPLTGEVQTIAPVIHPADTLRPPLNLQSVNPGTAIQGGSPRSAVGTTRVDISARDSTVDLNLKIQTNPENANERVYLGSGGVRVTIDSPEIASSQGLQNDQGQQVVILADNVVAWQSYLPDGESQWEIYLEGNIVFSKGTRVVYSEQMYYEANSQRGTILNADMLTPIAKYRGLVRLKADVIQQLDANTMQAFGAAFTSSRMGVPRYWLQSSGLEIKREQIAGYDDDSGLPLVDSYTGQPQMEDEYFADSRDNYIYLSDWPIFYWPRFRTSLNDPTLYLDRVRLGNDRIFGAQIFTGWNMYQLLGIRNRPENTRWIGVVDYLSERGFGLGNEVDYSRDRFLGIPGTVKGMTRSWFIQDSGLDTLGRGRANLLPEEDLRGRFLSRHRHEFEPGFNLRAEVGYVSDRNFLEQYYERSWDQEKDYTTGLWLERNIGTQSFNLVADGRVNRFFTQTSWLPKFDHFVLGQSLFSDKVVWHSRSQVGYGQLRAAEAPLNPIDLAPFNNLPWEADVDGVRIGSRNELDFPQQFGPLKVVPYVLGDVTYWQEDLNGDDLLRGYGQTGIKTSLPFWKVDPTVQSTLWNVNGLAHKISFDSELFYADASQDLNELPLYDPLDDDSQEAFRRRIASTTFGILPPGDVPLPYDERYFALRRGMQSWVTAGSTEIADDLTVAKFGIRQRWQTKRGLPGQERIIDWITLDAETALFPDGNRDNFGADWGLMDYDFQWHIGDRLSLVSDGYFDFFSQGLRTASVGMHMSRPEVGNFYLGYRSIEGPISSNIVMASVVYRMSDKWGVRAGTAVDFGSTGTIGQSLSLVYIGESFLWRFGINADASRGNVGFQFGMEPRFLSKQRMFLPGGVAVAPAGAQWLE
jgi:lipopolysaccharide export system protein LptA